MVYIDDSYHPELSHFTPEDKQCMDDLLGVSVHNLKFKKNTNLKNPLQIIYCTNTASEINNIITLEENSSATIIEHHINLKSLHATALHKNNQINLHPNSKLDYYLIQQESDSASHVAQISIEQAKQTTCNLYNCLLSGNQYQCTTNINFNDINCQANVYGFYRAVEQQNIAQHCLINHHAPHCSTNVLFKGTADHNAKVIFKGKITVDQNAPKSYARLVNKNLLLSKDAIIDTSPELEIYTDDVQCSHGATVGQLDQNVLFYLRSRGIDYSSARNLLLQAFVNEVIDLMPIDLSRRCEEALRADEAISNLEKSVKKTFEDEGKNNHNEWK